MQGADALKSYLVKLGFDIDNDGFNKFKNTLNEIAAAISKNSSEIKQQYVEAGSAVVGAVATITGALTTLSTKVAEADLTYQLFAQRMYMSNEMAKSFKITTDALGHSLNEIAWNPELRHHYFELLREVRGMQVPQNVRETYEGLRSVGFEWTRVKVEALSAMDWIVFHLVKMNHGELSDFKGSLSFINDKIQNNMPEWTNKVAKFLNPFVIIGRDIALVFSGVLRIFGGIFSFFEKGWEKMPVWQRNIVSLQAVLLSLFTAGMVGGKLGAFIKGITLVTTALLLLDDAIAHFEGRPSHSVLAFFWDFGEKINLYFTKVITNALLAWVHFKRVLSGQESPDSAWSNFMKEKTSMNLEMDKVVDDIRKDREASKREIIRQQQQAGGGLGPQVYEVPSIPGKVEGNAVSRIESYAEQIRKASEKYGISEDLIRSVIYTESRGRHDIVSNKGAIGLMQIMPSTAALYGVSSPYLYDWKKNIDLGARILSDEIRGGGSIEEGLRRYNAGGNWRNKARSNPRLNEETGKYARSVLNTYDYYNQRRSSAAMPSPGQKGNVSIKQGDVNVNVNVTNPGASADDISRMTARRIKEEVDRNNLILSREFSGVY